MCGHLQLSQMERLRTEDAIRTRLGPKASRWNYGGFLRSEKLTFNTRAKRFLWCGKHPILALVPMRILGFWEYSRDIDIKTGNRRPLYFDATSPVIGSAVFDHLPSSLRIPGQIVIAVHNLLPSDGVERTGAEFRIVTHRDEMVAALCRKDRGPLVIPFGESPTNALKRRCLVAA